MKVREERQWSYFVLWILISGRFSVRRIGSGPFNVKYILVNGSVIVRLYLSVFSKWLFY